MPNKAIDLYCEITEPNEIIINLLFNACADLGTDKALSLVKKTSSNMPKSFYSNPFILTSLIDAFMKCGDAAQAQSLFEKTTVKILPMYGAMMKGNKNHHISKSFH